MRGQMKSTEKRLNQQVESPTLIRTTFLIPDVLDRNVEIFGAMNGLKKSDVVRSALSEYLMKHGLDPSKQPKLVQD